MQAPEVYIVGTSHQKVTADYKRELERVFKLIEPDQILLEKLPIEVKTGQFRADRPEMKIAYDWAKTHGKKVAAFDHNINIIAKSISPKELAGLNDRLTSFTIAHDWKILNQPQYIDRIGKMIEPYLDKRKHANREARMLRAIDKKAIKSGKVLILTGTMHLPTFGAHFKQPHFLPDVLED